MTWKEFKEAVDNQIDDENARIEYIDWPAGYDESTVTVINSSNWDRKQIIITS